MTLTSAGATCPRAGSSAPSAASAHTKAAVQVLIVGDRSSVAEGLRRMSAVGDMCLSVAEASPLRAATAVQAGARPTVVLIDLRPGADHGLRRRALPELSRRFGAGRIIALVAPDGSSELRELLSLKVGGIINHDSSPPTAVRAIRAVLAGYTFHDFRQQAVRGAGEGSDMSRSLSPREREVIRLLVAGRTNREIGEAMSIAESTAKNHIQMLLRKLGARSRVQLAFLAGTHGLV